MGPEASIPVLRRFANHNSDKLVSALSQGACRSGLVCHITHAVSQLLTFLSISCLRFGGLFLLYCRLGGAFRTTNPQQERVWKMPYNFIS